MTIDLGEKTFSVIGSAITDLLNQHVENISAAYWNAEKELTLAVSIKLEPVDDGNKIDISLNFVKDRVKDKVVKVVNEKQGELFGGDGE